MKFLLLAGAFLGVVGYAWMSGGDPNVYPLSQAETYAKLNASDLPSDGKSAFGRLSYSTSGNGTSKVFWDGTGGTFASVHCEAEITPEGTAKSRVMAFCGGGGAGDGAAAGMVSGMERRALIEHIDATLTNRPFDPAKSRGATAARWPTDSHQPDGSYGTMVGDALKMDRDIHKSIKAMEKMERESAAGSSAAVASSQASVGRPSVDLSSSAR